MLVWSVGFIVRAVKPGGSLTVKQSGGGSMFGRLYVRVLLGAVFIMQGVVYDGTTSGLYFGGHDESNENLDADGLLRASMHALYAMHFDLADSLTGHFLASYPDHYLAHVARANYYWWFSIASAPDNFKKGVFAERVRKAKELAERFANGKMRAQPEILFHLISLSAMSVRYEVMHANYLRALSSGRQAIGYISASSGEEDSYPGFYLTNGLYNYMVATAAERNYLFRMFSLFYPPGDKLRGLEQLKLAASQDDFILQTEAHYFLMRIYLDLEVDSQQALYHAGRLTDIYPSNLIYRYYYLLAYAGVYGEERVLAERHRFRRLVVEHNGLCDAQRAYFLGLVE